MRWLSERGGAARAAVLLFAATGLYWSGAFPPCSNPNEVSRYQLVYAIAETRSFEIGAAVARLGEHEDMARDGARVYSNKAPGLAFAAAPVYAALRLVMAPPETAADLVLLALRALVVTMASVLALGAFADRLARDGTARPAAALVVVAVGLGTPLLFYARTFFSHAFTAALVYGSWEALRRAEAATAARAAALRMAAAGLCAGWAAVSEYPAGVLAACLGLRACAASPRPADAVRNAALFALGAALPLGLLAFYDAVCFGSPFVLSSARESHPEFAALNTAERLFGFGPPHPGVALAYLVDPARGVLWRSPFWAFVPLGLWRLCREPSSRRDGLFLAASCVLFFALMTGYANWHGGWTLGNRYLLPAVFLAGLALPPALRSPAARSLFAAAVVYAVATHLLLTATWPSFPLDLTWSAKNGALWFLAKGWVAPSLLSRVSPGLSLALPALATAGVVALALRESALGARRAALATAAGVAAFALSLSAAPAPPANAQDWRVAALAACSGRADGARATPPARRAPTDAR